MDKDVLVLISTTASAISSTMAFLGFANARRDRRRDLAVGPIGTVATPPRIAGDHAGGGWAIMLCIRNTSAKTFYDVVTSLAVDTQDHQYVLHVPVLPPHATIKKDVGGLDEANIGEIRRGAQTKTTYRDEFGRGWCRDGGQLRRRFLWSVRSIWWRRARIGGMPSIAARLHRVSATSSAGEDVFRGAKRTGAVITLDPAVDDNY